MRLVNSVTERESSSWRVVASQLMGRAVRRTALRPERRRGNLTEAAISVAILGLAVGCAATSDLESEAAELRALHERVLEAHRTGDVDAWLTLEAEEYVSVNRGRITFPPLADRRAAREPYLSSTTFTVYRDLRPPIVRLSPDARLGWLIAEVEVRGTQLSDSGQTSVDAIWAWIELYEKDAGRWRLVGNVSNRRLGGI